MQIIANYVVSYTYDGMGNPNALDGWSFTWKHGRELATMSNGTTTWTNTYNADGLRTKRTNGSTTYSYVYTGSSLLSMTVGSNTLYFNYDAAGTPLTVTWNGTTYYYATNLQGDVVAILDSSGNTVVSYTYDAWGNPASTTGTLATTLGTINPLRYRGYVYDTETDLYYLQSRYYNAELGRFINADGYTSTNQGFSGNNTFVYCGNSPITFSDYGGNRYCAATTVAGETSDDRSMACEFQKEIIREKRIKDYGAATAYVPNSDTDTNCVGYALGVDGWLYVGDNNSPSFCLFTTVLMTITTSISNGHGIRIISSYDSPISSDEYRIALRIGESDYHFMVQHNDGSWSHKPGVCPSRLVTGDDPRAMSWDRPEINERLFYYTGKVEETNVVPNYYDSYTVFFAVRK